jgi:hypothetical protein
MTANHVLLKGDISDYAISGFNRSKMIMKINEINYKITTENGNKNIIHRHHEKVGKHWYDVACLIASVLLLLPDDDFNFMTRSGSQPVDVKDKYKSKFKELKRDAINMTHLMNARTEFKNEQPTKKIRKMAFRCVSLGYFNNDEGYHTQTVDEFSVKYELKFFTGCSEYNKRGYYLTPINSELKPSASVNLETVGVEFNNNGSKQRENPRIAISRTLPSPSLPTNWDNDEGYRRRDDLEKGYPINFDRQFNIV